MRGIFYICFLLVFFKVNAQSIEVKWNVASLIDDVIELAIERGFNSKNTIHVSAGYYDNVKNTITTSGVKLEFQYRFYLIDAKKRDYVVNSTENKQTHYFKNENKNREFGLDLFHVNSGLFYAPVVNTFQLKSEREKFTSYGAGGVIGYKIHKKRLFVEVFGGAGYYLVDNENEILKAGVNPLYGFSIGAIL